MKNTFLCLIVMLCSIFGTTSFAQSFNFSGGLTMSKVVGINDLVYTSTNIGQVGITYSSLNKMKFLSGFNASVGCEFRLNNRLSIQTGFKFQTAGYRLFDEYSYISDTGSYYGLSTFESKLKFLHIPVVLNTAIITNNIRVYFRTGLSIGVLTGMKYSSHQEFESTTEGFSFYDETGSANLSDYKMGNRLTAGFIAGVGVEYRSFYFESNLDMGPYSLDDLTNKVYYQNIGFSLGYKIKYKKVE